MRQRKRGALTIMSNTGWSAAQPRATRPPVSGRSLDLTLIALRHTIWGCAFYDTAPYGVADCEVARQLTQAERWAQRMASLREMRSLMVRTLSVVVSLSSGVLKQ